MKNSIKIKNICILVFTYIIGFLSGLLFVYYGEIDLLKIYSLLNRETSIDQGMLIEEVPGKEENNGSIIEEKVEEIDKCPILADISGAVKNPGVYCFDKDSAVVDGIKKAGGFLNSAGFKYVSMNINLAHDLIDKSKVYIPYQEDLLCETVEFMLPKEVEEVINPPENDEEEETEEEGNNSCININTASKESLMDLNGVGESTAQKIIDARPFEAIEDILDVSGIGDATYAKFKDEICI